MNQEARYWRERYEMLMANFGHAIKDVMSAQTKPNILADKESFEAGWLLGAQEEREACWRLCDALWIEGKDAHDCREAIRARGNA
jgi:hypothetical protein